MSKRISESPEALVGSLISAALIVTSMQARQPQPDSSEKQADAVVTLANVIFEKLSTPHTAGPRP